MKTNKYLKLVLALLVVALIAGILFRNHLYSNEAGCRGEQDMGIAIGCAYYPIVPTVGLISSVLFVAGFVIGAPILYLTGRKK